MHPPALSRNVSVKLLCWTYAFLTLAILLSLALMFTGLGNPGRLLHFYQDFDVFYDVARRMHDADARAIYRESTHDLLASLQGDKPSYLSNPFLYPPHFMLFLYPWGFLSHSLALLLWLVCAFAVWVGVFYRKTVRGHFASIIQLRSIRRAYPLLLLASPFLYPNIVVGQVDPLLAGMMITMLCIRRQSPVLAGMLLGCLTVKPHLALLFPLLFLMERNYRALACALMTALGLIAVTTGWLGAGIWADYAQSLRIIAPSIEADIFDTAKSTISFYHLFRLTGLSVAAATFLQGLIAIALASLLLVRNPHFTEASRISAWLVLAMMLSPYLLIYNLCPLAFVACIMADRCLKKPDLLSLFMGVLFAGLPYWPALHLLPMLGIPFALVAGLLYLTCRNDPIAPQPAGSVITTRAV